MQMGHQSILCGRLLDIYLMLFPPNLSFFCEQNIVSEKNFFHEDDFFIVSNVSLFFSSARFAVPQWVEIFLLIFCASLVFQN
jgi:hypothetical protein